MVKPRSVEDDAELDHWAEFMMLGFLVTVALVAVGLISLVAYGVFIGDGHWPIVVISAVGIAWFYAAGRVVYELPGAYRRWTDNE